MQAVGTVLLLSSCPGKAFLLAGTKGSLGGLEGAPVAQIRGWYLVQGSGEDP